MGDNYTGPVTVLADDGTTKVLDNKNVWEKSETILEMVGDTDPGDVIPLASVSKEALDNLNDNGGLSTTFEQYD